MTEKKSEKMTNSSKPVPMKLFAAWEVDRTPSNCIPRYVLVIKVHLNIGRKLVFCHHLYRIGAFGATYLIYLVLLCSFLRYQNDCSDNVHFYVTELSQFVL